MRLRFLWSLLAHDSCQVRRLSPVIFHQIIPLNASIVADNLDYFKLHYIKSDKTDRSMIKIASMCSAEKITGYLLEGYENVYEHYNYILPHVVGSGNAD